MINSVHAISHFNERSDMFMGLYLPDPGNDSAQARWHEFFWKFRSDLARMRFEFSILDWTFSASIHRNKQTHTIHSRWPLQPPSNLESNLISGRCANAPKVSTEELKIFDTYLIDKIMSWGTSEYQFWRVYASDYLLGTHKLEDIDQ